ncbi:acetate/propionate family kinase [Ferrovibrio xuzhouensis]|uniref:Acetate kinase n=1 Tax=Ferrovibrio xuzhouensis TaxID=1576914 RepID=A0ABV7VCP8_9PROT
MTAAILVLNAGSSSIKFALFPAADEPARATLLCAGQCAGLGHHVRFTARDGAGKALLDRDLGVTGDHEAVLGELLAWIGTAFAGHRLVAAAHRVVHGGPRYSQAVLIDAEVTAELEKLVPLAPLHQPHHLAAIAAIARLHPDLPQVACFDTAFHHTQPAVATAFALPRALTEGDGIRRYGFHGLSYAYIAGRLAEVAGPLVAAGRVVVAHLGSGASMCALQDGRSIATTMGFTALDGLPMSRRCGAIDPGVLLYLMQQKGMSAAAVSDLLYHDSGLYGVSGVSDDMQELLASDDPRAARAIDLFVYRIGRELGSLVAALGGLDALVFTAGIGEHAAEIRRRVCLGAGWLGLDLLPAANAVGATRISAPGSRVSAWVIPTDEDLMIAREARALLQRRS